MDLLTAIGACSVAKDFTLVFAMVIAFSQGQPYAVKDAASVSDALYAADEDETLASEAPDEEPRQPRTREEAVAKLAELRVANAAPVLGLLPVPPAWALQFQRKVLELFDPCINISIASAAVSQCEYECGAKAERACVLQCYGAVAGLEDFDIIVLDTIESHAMPAEREVILETDEVFNAPIYAPNAERDWGADKIFFRTLSPPTKTKGAQNKRNERMHSSKVAAKRPATR